MSKDNTPDPQLLESVWAEARDLARRLEGSSVQRLSVSAGNCKIEIERVQPVAGADGAAAAAPASFGGVIAPGAGPGLGVAPAARGASGSFAALPSLDNRIPVLAPLVGTFYRAPRPGEPNFVEVGDVVELGQTVCIVEAMKLMNEVQAGDGGRVVEIAVENGEPVEYEQVLMYLEPVE